MKSKKQIEEHRLWMLNTAIQFGKIKQRLNRRKKSVSDETRETAEKLYSQLLEEWNRLYQAQHTR